VILILLSSFLLGSLVVTSFACFSASCRVLANVLFPNWLVTVLLLGLLLFLTYKAGKKAVSLHRCEVRYLALREEQRAARGVRPSDQACAEPLTPARSGK
jgi:hypothetical protein